MPYERRLDQVSDSDLLLRLRSILEGSRLVESDLVAHIGEVDSRRLYAREASPSMHAYCTEVLHLSDAEAFLRIQAARASRAYPAILEMLADGRLHLSAIALLAPHLTRENHAVLLARATHKTKREVEEILAAVAPRPDVPSLVRKLPEEVRPTTPHVPAPPPRGEASELRPDGVSSSVASSRVEALAPARYKVQFTASAEFRGKLLRLQALMRSRFPDGDLAQVVEDAVTEKLERLEARRYAKTVQPRTEVAPKDDGSRYLPAALRRAVAVRDENRCRFADARGRRCSERHRLEYHHRIPFGMGGGRTLSNIALMCRAHNQYLAERDFGREKMERHRSAGKRPSATT
jgi:hypothetical protein